MQTSIELPESLEELAHRWRERDIAIWRTRPDLYLSYGRRAITLGQPTLAVDILDEGLKAQPGHGGMSYSIALALLNCGSLRQAKAYLESLLEGLSDDHPLRSDTLSLAGRLAKDRWSKVKKLGIEKQSLLDSANWYQQAYQLSKDYYPCINAASMNRLAGRHDESRRYAQIAKDHCMALPDREINHWVSATLGEACLLLDEFEDSITWYSKAIALAGGRIGDVASMYRQLRLLTRYDGIGQAVIDGLSVPRVGVFSGHMVDHPHRQTPRFPSSIEKAVTDAIGETIDRRNIGVGYASLACGGDIIFVEQMLRRGHEVNVVLPFEQEDFIRTSVAFAGWDWVERFERVLKRVTRIYCALDENYLGDDLLFTYTSDLLHGAAILRGSQLGLDPVMIALVDVESVKIQGGTIDVLSRWDQFGGESEIVDINKIRENAPKKPNPPVVNVDHDKLNRDLEENRNEFNWCQRKIGTMLFADMVGFSRLQGVQAPSFIVHFLGEVGKVIKACDPQPLFCNTWGDGLFIVFSEVEHGAALALEIRDRVREFSWVDVGLPEDTDIRIGMHTGPVFPAQDPIIDRLDFFGSHVNRAARIEPVTAPGAVYVSEQSAALLAITQKDKFRCDYLGEKSLAKEFGIHALYRLRRANEIE